MTVDEALSCLRKAFDSDRFAQAYIIVGPLRAEGIDLTNRVLQLLFCEGPNRPCGACRGCAAAERHTHPDLFWVEPRKKSRIISVDQVRELRTSMTQTAYEGGWKACVMVGADRLMEAAANTFLKTLEEPPPRSVFLLPTDAPQFLLPTIVSRCQHITVSTRQSVLSDAGREVLLQILQQRPGTGGVLTALARGDRLAGMLKAMKNDAVAAENGIAGSEATEETDETIDARANARYREMRTDVMRTLLHWYRDLLLLSFGGDESLLYHQDRKEALRPLAAKLSCRQALCNLRTVEDMNRQMERNMPESHVLAAGCCQLLG